MDKQLLKFVPLENHWIGTDEPGTNMSPGQFHQVLGHRFNPKTNSYIPTGEALEVDPDSRLARKLIKLSRKKECGLLPFDAFTAAKCGLNYEPVKYDAKSSSWLKVKAEITLIKQ